MSQNSEEFVKLIERNITKAVEQEADFNDLESIIPKIFGSGQSDRAFEEYLDIVGVPDAYAWEGRFRTQKQVPGYTNKVIFQRFANRLEEDPALIEDKQYPVLEQRARDLRNSYDRKKEKMGVHMFSKATSTAFDFQESEEGLSWANDSHTTKAPGVSTTALGGFDNVGTSVLDPTSLEAAWVSMMRFRDDAGNLFQDRSNFAIVHPVTLTFRTEEIIGTDRGLYTDEGTINVHQGRYSSLPYPLLDEVSTSAWTLIRVERAKKDLLWFNRIEPKYTIHIDRDTLATIHSIQGRFGYMFKGWRFGFHQNA